MYLLYSWEFQLKVNLFLRPLSGALFRNANRILEFIDRHNTATKHSFACVVVYTYSIRSSSSSGALLPLHTYSRFGIVERECREATLT